MRGTFPDYEVTQLLVDEEPEVARDDFIRVAVADDDAEAVWSTCGATFGGGEAAGHCVSVLGWDRGQGKGPEVEEYDDIGGGKEFLEEVDKDCRGCGGLACFVEEDAYAFDGRYGGAAEVGG